MIPVKSLVIPIQELFTVSFKPEAVGRKQYFISVYNFLSLEERSNEIICYKDLI